MSSIKTDTVTVLTAGTVTDRGTVFPDWSSPTETTVADCRVQPVRGEEALAFARQGVKDWRRLFGPADMTLTTEDRVRWDGKDFEVESVMEFDSPTGAVAHIEAVLYLMEG